MPNFNGTGPAGVGVGVGVEAVNGRGRGPCCGGKGAGRSLSRGYGRRPEWFSVGYTGDVKDAPSGGIKASLEKRKALLCAELAEIETLLGRSQKSSQPPSAMPTA